MYILLMMVLIVAFSGTNGSAEWNCQCVNDGICEAYICAKNVNQARFLCKNECGNYATIQACNTSNCQPKSEADLLFKLPIPKSEKEKSSTPSPKTNQSKLEEKQKK